MGKLADGPNPSEEDGVCVYDAADTHVLFTVEYACFEDSYGKKPIFKLCDENWHELIASNPYLYFD